jgi:hypothetical protein
MNKKKLRNNLYIIAQKEIFFFIKEMHFYIVFLWIYLEEKGQGKFFTDPKL